MHIEIVRPTQAGASLIVINAHEARQIDDVRSFLRRLVPPGDTYLHNEIHLRDCPPDEPENAHARMAETFLGTSESVRILGGKLRIGDGSPWCWMELDGPHERRVHIAGDADRRRPAVSPPAPD